MSHCDARVPDASRGQKFSKSKNFSKHVCFMFQDSGIILSEKNFSDFQTNQSPGIPMRFERQKLPLLVIREGGLSLFGSHGKGPGPRVSHCDAKVPDASRGQKFSKSKNFSTFFKTCLLHVSGLWDNFKRKKDFPTFIPPRVPVSQ